MKTGPTTSGIPAFILKTQQLIKDAPKELIEWSSDGTAFVIKRPKQLEKECLHRYFKHSNFRSFDRQLNFYGFQKSTKFLWINGASVTTRCAEYRQRNFVRGRFDLMKNINRKTSAANRVREKTTDLKHDLGTLTSNADRLRSQVGELLKGDGIEPISRKHYMPLTLDELLEFIPLD